MRIELKKSAPGLTVVNSLESAALGLGGKVYSHSHENSYSLSLEKEALQGFGLVMNLPCGCPRRGFIEEFLSMSHRCTGSCKFIVSPVKINEAITDFNVEIRLHEDMNQGGFVYWAPLDKKEDNRIATELLSKLMSELRKNLPN